MPDHRVLIVHEPDLGTELVCECGWRSTVDSVGDARAVIALHRALEAWQDKAHNDPPAKLPTRRRWWTTAPFALASYTASISSVWLVLERVGPRWV